MHTTTKELQVDKSLAAGLSGSLIEDNIRIDSIYKRALLLQYCRIDDDQVHLRYHLLHLIPRFVHLSLLMFVASLMLASFKHISTG
jgi:hypothetical protein